jgi:hypothetical protein
VSNRNLSSPSRFRLHDFDKLRLSGKPRLTMRCSTAEELPIIRSFLQKYIPSPTAKDDVIGYARMRNRNNLMVFCREDEIVGVYAMLMLNTLGLERLLLGEFDPLDPEPSSLALRLSTPAGIYQWAVVTPGFVSEGIFHVARFLQQPLYRHANLYARATTPAGMRICEAVGFRPLNHAMPDLYRYVRVANRPSKIARAA